MRTHAFILTVWFWTKQHEALFSVAIMRLWSKVKSEGENVMDARF
jgi:hypothetical protein